MIRFKISLLTVSLSVAVLGGILGKLAIDHHLPRQSAEANSGSAEIHKNGEIPVKATATHWRSKITFQEALQTAETAISGKAYSIERETEGGKPVIEVGVDGQEVFVDAESGKIVLIDNVRQKGDPEDIEEITEAVNLQQLATVPIQAALQVGESFAGKQAHAVGLKNEEGNLVYEVVVELQKVFIDAGNGQVLSTETVGKTDESNGSRPKSSIQVQ
jgi:uncharacterized membrane protein YkoI